MTCMKFITKGLSEIGHLNDVIDLELIIINVINAIKPLFVLESNKVYLYYRHLALNHR